MIKFKPCAALVFVYALLIAIDFLPAAEPTAWGRLMQSTPRDLSRAGRRAQSKRSASPRNRPRQRHGSCHRLQGWLGQIDAPPVRKVYNPARSVSQYMAQERP